MANMDGNNGLLIDRADEHRSREITLEYLNFLDDGQSDDKIYTQKVEDLIKTGGTRLIVNINDIRSKLPLRAKGLIANFVDEIQCLETATRDLISRADADYTKQRECGVGFEGSFGDRHCNPRTLKSRLLGNLVCCEGIVTKSSLVRPKVVRSVHYCPATKKTLERRYTDLTSYESFPSSTVYPTEDEHKNPLETEFGLSTYKDHQTFSIQEMPECAPAGQLPRSVDVIADDDLADCVKPGDRVRVVGLFRCLPNKQNGYTNGSFRTIVIANNIQLMSKEVQPNFDRQDVKNIRKLSKNKEIFSLLARSLAPSICGHEEEKKAILCLLIGGTEKILQNGTRLRGDINVLLIGDPSVAKSQLLRYVLHTAPRAIATTGRGSSGVGLTAAVTTDVETGERRLEAGAMVLADRGIVCIDEFDKMSDMDRTAIHEVMEQGRVTIAKAGIHAKLNARCSVLAAANPVFGRYDLYKTPMENICMQDSLLSRFDLIFVMLDEHEADHDKLVADHVVKLHRYRTPGESDGAVLPMGAAIESLSTFDLDEEETVSEIYEKNKGWISGKAGEKVLSMGFIRKYIHMAKAAKPQLTDEAIAYIVDCYSELRSFDTSKCDRERTMPVTARQLETLIRLATAHAKARLAKHVEKWDAESAFQLLHFACFKEKPKERREAEERENAKHKRHLAGDGEDEDDEDGDGRGGEDESQGVDSMDITEDSNDVRRSTRRRRAADTTVRDGSQDSIDMTDSARSLESDAPPQAKRVRRDDAAPAISVGRYKSFRQFASAARDQLGGGDMLELERVKKTIQAMAQSQPFNDDEMDAGFERLGTENVAMITDDTIIFM